MTAAPIGRLWIRILLAFALGVGAQVLMYAPMWKGGPVWNLFPSDVGGDLLYVPLVLFFFFGPAIIAAVVARRMLRRAYSASDRTPSPYHMFLIVVFAIMSCYAGVFICFNTWGT